MHQYKITVIHQGREVQVYPRNREPGTSFEEVCKRIGMMVMSERIELVTVYRDGELYRQYETKKGISCPE